MTTLPIIPKTFRCAFNWLGPGAQRAANVIHIRSTESGPVTAGDVWGAITSSVNSGMWGCTSGQYVVTDVAITPLDGTSATVVNPTGVTTPPSPWIPLSVGEGIPSMCSLVKLTTATRGRSHRGRVFVPFVAEGVSVSGVLLPASVNATTLGWNGFAASLVAAGHACELVVASYKLATAQAVINIACEPIAATQRRRQGRLRR